MAPDARGGAGPRLAGVPSIGPPPSINKIALHFKLNYKTVYYHVMKLIVEGRLRQERGKPAVVGSEWIERGKRPVRWRFDF